MRKRIVCMPSNGDLRSIIDELCKDYGFDTHIEILDSSVWADYTTIIHFEKKLPLFGQLDDTAKMAIVFNNINQLAQLEKISDEVDLIFAPQEPERLDLFLEKRKTLVTSRFVGIGSVFSVKDIATEIGGTGISQDLIDLIIGKCAVYSLDEGTPLDFGVFK